MSATAFFGGIAWFLLAHLISRHLGLGANGVAAMEVGYVVAVAVLLYCLEEDSAVPQADPLRLRDAASRQVVRCLAEVAAFHDGDTASHCERIGALAYELASELGVEHENCETLRHAAVLHDLGKIGVDRTILNKCGPLTEEERAAVRQHVRHGAELLDRTRLADTSDPVINAAMLAINTHHEWWDGGGYPLGLSGEQIPLEGRIVAVCDVFDALATDRPYRAAMEPDDARDIVRRSSGRQFDPNVVDAFERCYDRLLGIYAE